MGLGGGDDDFDPEGTGDCEPTVEDGEGGFLGVAVMVVVVGVVVGAAVVFVVSVVDGKKTIS